MVVSLFSLIKSFEKEISFEKRDLLEITAFQLKKNWQDLLLEDEVLDNKDVAIIEEMIEKRRQGLPLARIFGSLDFYSTTIFLTDHVLIPRPETEILLDKVFQKTANKDSKVVFDICCGSGCLGLAYKKNRPHAKVVLSDISPLALACAKENAKKNGLEVSFVRSDLLKDFPKGVKADLVLCNPPYISLEEYETLDESVRKYDPKLALVAPEKGLGLYKRLSVELPALLNKGAFVALEIGYTQAEEVKNFFNREVWRVVEVEKDYAGKDRFIFLELH